MKHIKLTGKHGLGKTALVDDEDFEKVNQFKWHLSGRYPVRNFGQRPNRLNIALHRFLMNTPIGMVTDHKNGNGLDNRKSNLRICTVSENIMNSKKSENTSSRFKGVCRNTAKPWRAYIGRTILGSFATEIEAANAYNMAAKKLYGHFARLNIID